MVDAAGAGPATERVRVRRGAIRAEYDRAAILAVLDAGMVAHVGVSTPDGPIVLPMAYGHDEEQLFLHGAVANAALRAAVGSDVCVTITVVDGLVVGRCPFHNSMNHRGVIVRGTARKVVDDAERLVALRTISDHVVATWASGREPSAEELRRTTVVAVPLTEASAKLRAGDPVDEPEDLDGPHWAGHVPIRSTWDRPVSSADLPAGVEVPAAIVALAGRPV